MKVTEHTRDALRCRRERRRLEAEGFEEVGERGGNLWQLHRGSRQDHVIVDVRIAPEGKSLFIKTVPVPRCEPKSRNVRVEVVEEVDDYTGIPMRYTIVTGNMDW